MRLKRFGACSLWLGLLFIGCGQEKQEAKRKTSEPSLAGSSASPAEAETVAAATVDLGPLAAGPSDEQKLYPGQTHSYRLERIPSTWLSIKLEPRTGDPHLVLADLQGKEILRVSEVRGAQSEWLVAPPVLSAKQGSRVEQQLRVVSSSIETHYRLEIEQVSDPAEPLRQRAEAQRLTQLAHELFVVTGNPEAISSHSRDAAELWLRLGEKGRAAGVLEVLGRYLAQTEQQEETISVFRRAVELRSELRHERAAAADRNYLGLALRRLGRSSQAREQFERALDTFESVPHLSGIAASLNNLGLLHWDEGAFDAALQKYEEALKVLQAKEPTTPGTLSQRARILENQARVHLIQGSTSLARNLLRSAEALRKSAKDVRGLAETRLELVWADILQEDFEAALSVLEELRSAEMDSLQRLIFFDRLATTYEGLGRAQEAGRAYQRANEIIHRDKLWTAGIGVLVNLCRRSVEAADENRLEICRQSVEKARSFADPNRRVSASYWWARALESENRPKEALAAVREAAAQLETLRVGILGLHTRADFWEHRIRILRDSIALLMRLEVADPTQGHALQAFIMSEQIRARATMDRLRATTGASFGEADPFLKEEYLGLVRDIDRLTELLRSRDEVGSEHPLNRAPPDKLHEQLELKLSRLDHLESKIRGDSRASAWLFPSTQLTLDDFRSVLDPDTAVLSLLLGPSESIVWVLTRDSFDSRILSSAETLSNRAKPWLNAIESGESDTTTLHLGRSLANELFGAEDQLLSSIRDKKRILFVADGLFHRLPVSALPLESSTVESPRYVVHQFEIVHVPSLMVALEIRGRAENPLQDHLAFFGDTFYDEASESAFKGEAVPEKDLQAHFPLSRPSEQVLRMPYGLEEVRNVSRHFDPERSLIATGPLANRNHLLSTDLSSYAVIHLSSHGLSNLDHPELSALLLSEFEPGGRRLKRSRLRLFDLFRLQWPVELVVVSACESGKGRLSLEGTAGMASGFLFAGAKRVVATLWKVDNQTTAILMDRFYFELVQSQKTPGEALREAKLSLIESGSPSKWRDSRSRWSSPRYWAAFVSIGDWQKLGGLGSESEMS